MTRQSDVCPPKQSGPQGGAVWIENGTAHIDVRGLPPPEPLVAILALLDADTTGNTVIVHHDRDPLMLYPELDDRNWAHARLNAPDGEVRLRLTRQNP